MKICSRWSKTENNDRFLHREYFAQWVNSARKEVDVAVLAVSELLIILIFMPGFYSLPTL